MIKPEEISECYFRDHTEHYFIDARVFKGVYLISDVEKQKK